jgi:hypothetical protein
MFPTVNGKEQMNMQQYSVFYEVNSIKFVCKVILFTVLIGFGCHPAFALILFEQPPLDRGIGFFSSVNASNQNLDNFSFSNDVSIRSITWWGYYPDNDLPLSGASFTVRIYGDSGGSPGTVIEHVDATSSALDSPFNTGLITSSQEEINIFRFDLVLTSELNLLAGDYYLAVMNDPNKTSFDENFDWSWSSAVSGDALRWLGSDGITWFSANPHDLAFQFNGVTGGSVSNASSLLLVLVGAISACIFSLRRKC